MARFKEVFPVPAKTDEIDCRKGLELFQLQQIIPAAKNVLQEVHDIPQAAKELKSICRRRTRLVNERTRYLNSLHADLTFDLYFFQENLTQIDKTIEARDL